MGQKIQIISDGSLDLPKELVKEKDIQPATFRYEYLIKKNSTVNKIQMY